MPESERPHPPKFGPPDGIVQTGPNRYEIGGVVTDGVLQPWDPEEWLETIGWMYDRLEGKRIRMVLEAVED